MWNRYAIQVCVVVSFFFVVLSLYFERLFGITGASFQIVNILYRENDWVYVIGLDTRQEGFIPHSYCTPYNSQLAELATKKKLPREVQLGNLDQTDVNHDW